MTSLKFLLMIQVARLPDVADIVAEQVMHQQLYEQAMPAIKNDAYASTGYYDNTNKLNV